MKSLWDRLTETDLASTVLLLCLAACGGEQTSPALTTTVPALPTAAATQAATVSAAAEPQPTATVAPAGTLVPVLPLTPTQTPETVTTPPAAPPPTAVPASTPAPTAEMPLAQTSAETDREALVALYNATDGERWNNNDNWQSDAPIDEWHGVTTGANGRVTELNLDSNHLTGNIPLELGNLNKLEALYLARNQLTGCVPSGLQDQLDRTYTDLGGLAFCRRSEAPTATTPPTQVSSDRETLVALYHATDGPSWRSNTNWLSDRPIGEWDGITTGPNGRVIVLNLNNNEMVGAHIPAEIGNLASLRSLDLRANGLTGSIPPELGHLTNLEWLSIGINQLTGSIPPELGNLTNLESLSIGINQLTGSIPPELGNLTSLESLFLGRNQLSGEIPAELGNLASLRGLQFYGNQLGGCVPISLQGQLDDAYTNLGGLSFCREAGTPTTTPPPAQTLSERETLVLFYHATGGPNWRDNTNWLSDAPLDEWQHVSTDSTGRVTVLFLNYNHLTGEIPPELVNLANLEWLDLTENELTGDIPPQLGNLANLEGLDFRNNELSGRYRRS